MLVGTRVLYTDQYVANIPTHKHAPLVFLHSTYTSQQSRFFALDFRRAATTHRPATRLAFALCTERGSDPRVGDLLRLTEPLVQHTEGDDGQTGEDEGVRCPNVPRAEDDAGVLYLGVPKVIRW